MLMIALVMKAEVQLDGCVGAYWGMCIGDAVAMPAHWYYDRSRIRSDFGAQGIKTYREPVSRFSGSIMSLSNTGGGGRGSDSGRIIGDVILHGKREFWRRGGDFHYHHGMAAGENTLDTRLSRLLMQSINEYNGRPGDAALLELYLTNYVRFLTTPDSHNDTYAATAHRMFFSNWIQAGKPTDSAALLQLSDNDGHNTDSIDGMINVVPTTLHFFRGSSPPVRTPDEVSAQHAAVGAIINGLRASETLPKYGVVLHELLWDLLSTTADVPPAEKLRQSIRRILPVIAAKTGLLLTAEQLERGRDPMTACYIQSSFPALLFFAYKYADDPIKSLLASVNAGGENVNRSAVLGAILGAAYGWERLKELEFEDGVSLVGGLVAKEEIAREISAFVGTLEPRAELRI